MTQKDSKAPRSNKDRLIGRQLGHYAVSELLAAGGMARIYKAIDVKLQRQVAVKVLEQEGAHTDDMLAVRFEREARAIASLEHPSIIPIYHYDEEDDVYYLAMKFVEGSDMARELSSLRRRGEKMDVMRGIRLLEQVASALDYAHSKGVIHRDIKPSNILLDGDDRAILTDFGLVLRSTDMTMGTAFGTPRYIAPEQAIASEKAVPQSDIYSLAVIVYEVLTGQTPFQGETPMEIALSHISEPPPPPTSIEPSIPKEVEVELLKALEKEPTKRHKTATDLIMSIKRVYDPNMTPVPGTMPAFPQSVASSGSSVPAPAKATPPAKDKKEKVAAPIVLPSVPTPKINEPVKTAVKSKDQATKPIADKPRRSPLRLLPLLLALLAVGAGAWVVLNNNNSNGGGVIVEDVTATNVVTDQPAPTEDVVEPSEEPTTENADVTSATETPPISAGGDGIPVTLRYDYNLFVMENATESAINVRELSFVRGEIIYAGSNITRGELPASACFPIAVQNRNSDVGDVCSTFHSRVTLPSDSPALFWHDDDAQTEFEVRLDDDVLAICPTVARGAAAAECPVELPASN